MDDRELTPEEEQAILADASDEDLQKALEVLQQTATEMDQAMERGTQSYEALATHADQTAQALETEGESIVLTAKTEMESGAVQDAQAAIQNN